MTSFLHRPLAVIVPLFVAALLGACSQTPLPPAAPNAVVSGGGSVPFGTTVMLDAGGSSGDDLDFAWSFESMPAGATPLLSSSGTAATSFTPDRSGTYVVRIEVGNAGGNDSATVTVVVEPVDVGGDWILTLSIGGGSASHPMTLIQNGTSLSGALTCCSEVFPVNGTIDGDELTFVLIDVPFVLTFTGTASADGTYIGGSIRATDGSTTLAGSFSAVRAP